MLKTFFKKAILLLIAMQILNLSVYGSAFQQIELTRTGKVEMKMNQIDSFTEFVAEIVLSHKDAFPEQGNNHTKNDSKIIKNIPFQLFYKSDQAKEVVEIPSSISHNSHFIDNYRFLFIKEFNPPPSIIS